MDFVIGFVVGAVVGAAIAVAVGYFRSRAGDRQMRETFAALAGEALDANSRRLADAAAATLDGKKALIDQSVAAIGERLETVRQALQRIESERKQEFGQLSSSVTSLATTTGELHKMLASTQRRGAWGERMAEDVLRLAGLQETVNYVKQSSADAAGGSRADFTFLLPNDLKVNMDVKFPLEKYKAYLDAQTDQQRAASAKELCSAVKLHLRDVASRGYIDPNVPTVPYVLVLIPSEQIYSLVLETQPDLIDDALRQKIVLCSPLTLYATLAIMRQAAENFNVMRTAGEVIALLGEFKKQWANYNLEMDRLGQRIDATAKQYELLRTTRSNMLQRPLDRIEGLSGGAAADTQDTTEDYRMRYLVATIISALLCTGVWGFELFATWLEQRRMQKGQALPMPEAMLVGGAKMMAENFFWICVMIFIAVTSMAIFLDRERTEKEEEPDADQPDPPAANKR